MKRAAFVTGATGFIGGHLVDALLDGGWRVIAAHRASSDVARLRTLGVELVLAPLLDPRAVTDAVPADVDAVFHLAASTSVWRLEEAQQIRSNVEATRNVIAAALARDTQCFVHCSSEAVYGMCDGVVDETSPANGREGPTPYHRTKWMAERAVLDARGAGLRPVILQPAHVMGPRDKHNWARMIRMIDEESLPGIPPGAGSFVDARDVAAAMVAAVDRGRVGERYLLGGHDLSFEGLMRKIAEHLGRGLTGRVLPAPVMRALAVLYEAKGLVTGEEPDISTASVELVTHRMLVDSAKARRELGFSNRSLDVTLDDTIAWMREAGMLAGPEQPGPDRPGAEHRRTS